VHINLDLESLQEGIAMRISLETESALSPAISKNRPAGKAPSQKIRNVSEPLRAFETAT